MTLLCARNDIKSLVFKMCYMDFRLAYRVIVYGFNMKMKEKIRFTTARVRRIRVLI